MFEKLSHIKGENKKYLTVFLFILLSIILLGVISPIIVEKKKQNWETEIKSISASIEKSVVSAFNEKEYSLLNDKNDLKQEIRSLLSQNKPVNGYLFELLSKSKYSSTYSVEIFNNQEKMIAWNRDIAVSPEDVFPLRYEPSDVHFCRTGLETYLSVIDTLKVGSECFYIAISLPVEKYYQLQNDYYKSLSLSNDLSQKYMTSFEIDFSPISDYSKDGRKQSVEIKNNFDRRIAVVTFTKPARETNLASLEDLFINLQSALAVLAFITLGVGLSGKLKKTKYRTIKFILYFLFLSLFRALLFVLNIPSKFVEGPITDAANFASAFGFGIVRSPLEFSITIIISLLICIYLFENIYCYVRSTKKNINTLVFYGLAFLSAAVFLVELRGLGASLRSIIFDSSLRYFKEPGLLPNWPAGLMQFNFLLLGVSSVIISCSIVLWIFSLIPANKSRFKKEFILVFIIFQALGFAYDFIQDEPQGTPLIRILYITLVFVLTYKIIFEEKKNLFNYVYFALISSIITISLLNFYNTQLEKESLKTTAFELTRTNDEWLQYLIREALFNASTNQETIKALKEQQTNYETAAFVIWSQSSLQREEISSAITFLDKQKAFLGSFGINLEPKFRVSPSVLTYNGDELQIFDNYKPQALNGKLVSGIIPVKEDDILLGYVVATVLYDPGMISSSSFPGFLSSKISKLNSTVSFDKLKVFIFNDNQLTNVYGDLAPADWHIENIIHAGFSENNDAWINLNINKENYITYLFREIENNSSRIVAVSLKEKSLSWSLYNFFKVFFIHSIFIISLFFVIYSIQLRSKNRELRYTFRTQLLTAFLFISLLPMLLLAFYNRSVTAEKNRDIAFYKLKQNAADIENYIKEHLADSSSSDIRFICDNARRDLNIEFSLFSGNKLYYSTKEEFFLAGIVPSILDPLVFDKLYNQGYKEFIADEKIENYPFISFSTKVKLGNRDFVLCTNDMFSKTPLPITGEEVDIFLFGSYFFAIILVIILSTVLANRISSPIRNLTKATASVAGGDLNFEIKNNQKGEIRDLISGFNSMIKELKRSQAELAEMEREIAWKEMARQVAHEIKNPLTPMKLAVQQLIIAYKDKSPKLDMIFEKVSQTIISQVETLNNIASEFSTFARMPKLKVEELELNGIVDDACNLFIEENIKITIHRDSENYRIEADRDQLKRTIINLIRNSIQASASRININIYKSVNKVSLEFLDNGKGIPKEHMDKVFQENFTTKEKGMGLGLKLAKKFMESIKGNISIVDSSPEGTKILLEFPLKQII